MIFTQVCSRSVRRSFGAVFLLAAVPCSCYRAEIDLASLRTDGVSGSDGGTSTGDAGSGAAGSGGGSGGETSLDCDPSPLDENQSECDGPAPLDRSDCSVQDLQGWSGCYSGGCSVCAELLAAYPFYLKWHPCCAANTTCNSNIDFVTKCDARCPAPTERDKVPPCAGRDVRR